MIKGQFFSIKTFEKSIRETNLIKEVAKVNVHITFISGKHDLLVPKLFPKNIIESPNKEYFIFDNSSHSAIWEEHDKFLEIIKENSFITKKI